LVARLRRVLDPTGAPEVVASRPPGYLLAVDPEQVDAVRFERLAAEGHAALAGGRPDDAAALLAEGLALWCGPALADVGSRALRRGGGRPPDRAAAGRHAAVVGELEAR
jgi:DNA-binding SARP family transcriptional activator